MRGPERLRYSEKKQRYRKAGILAFILLFLVIIAGTLFGESGILANLGVQAEYTRLLDEKNRLLKENQRLLEEIRELKSSQRKIEEIGRRDFGFGRPGEIIFYFPKEAEKPVQMYRKAVEETAGP
ncbi:MAG: septum formation initiator family protein [Acidobacteriota bacterium]|nr:septum formation initiator family protein [Acidobacteriota bacterium]